MVVKIMEKLVAKAILGFVFLVCGTLAAQAATLTVTKTADTDDSVCDSDCSLREAIFAAALSGDTIVFAASPFNSAQTITLTNGMLFINKDLTINGPGANLLTISGNNASRVFYITGQNIIIRGMTITGGRANDGDGGGGIASRGHIIILENIVVTGNQVVPADQTGGGIYNTATNITINNSTISNNSASRGGGISHSGNTLRINNTTINGNTATGDAGDFTGGGAGIFAYSNLVYMANSTMSGNSAPNGTGGAIKAGGGLQFITHNVTISNNSALDGGGIYVLYIGAYYGLRNTIIAGNTATTNPDISGNFNTGVYANNLVGNRGSAVGFSGSGNTIGTSDSPVDPRLAPLGFYGGTTQTHALLNNSPAIDTGSDCVLTANSCGTPNPELTTDQRGAPRKVGTAVDIGAFERNIVFNPATVPNATVSQPYNGGNPVQISAVRQTESGTSNIASSQLSIFQGSLPPGLTLNSSGEISGTPTNAGTYNFTLRSADTDGMTGLHQYTIQVFPVTAASVSISGRIVTPDGRGLRNAKVILTDASGNSRTTTSSQFGYYRFNNVEVGQIYVITVASKKYQFLPQTVTVTEEVSDLNFAAQKAGRQL